MELSDEVCEICFAKACWIHPSGDLYCDEHVPRGCSCNYVLKEDVEPILDEDDNIINPIEDYEEALDERGRKFPCCEYFYFEE